MTKKIKKEKNYIPLIKSNAASKIFNTNIFYKLENLNPTGSHKDRECKYILTKKNNFNYDAVGCASTGNLAISLAYYAKKYNKKCHIWIKKNTPQKKIKILENFKSKIYIKNQSLNKLYLTSNKFMKRKNILNLNPRINKDKIAANKIIGEEIINQNKKIDLFICTINNGSLFLGIYESIKKFKNKSLIGVYTYSKKASSINGLNLNEDNKLLSKFKNNYRIKLIEAKDSEIKKNEHIFYKDKLKLEYDCSSMLAVLKKIDLKKFKNICCILSGKKK